MAKFSKNSLDQLNTVHPDLQRLFNEVIKHYDCIILEGHRNEARQNKAFAEGNSKVKWPEGNHNDMPSNAVDVSPWPIPYKWGETDPRELARFYHFVGYVKATADQMGIDIRCGADWDGDNIFNDQSFHDLPHFELKKK